MFITFLTALTPILLTVSIGFVIAKKTDYLDHPSLAMLSSQIALPALVFLSIINMQMPVGDLFYLMGVTACCLGLGAGLVWMLCSIKKLDARFYLSTLVNPNTGNLGIPLVYALLGEDALAPAIIISTTVTLSHFTLGISAMSGSWQWQKLIKNMPLLALFGATWVLLFNLNIPAPIQSTLEMLSGMALPIMLLLLGRSLTQLQVNDTRQLGIIGGLSIYRPVSGLVIALMVLPIVNLAPLLETTLLMQMSMPVAVMSYILTLRYNGPANRIAALTLTSIPVSLIVLMLIYNMRVI